MAEAESAPVIGARERLLLLARRSGNIADAMTNEALTALGNTVVTDYEKDDNDRSEWKGVVEEMLKLAAQSGTASEKTTPWPNASNVNVPLLTIAALQFNARMYPAAIKGDEAVLCKVIGQDNGVPVRGPNPISGAMQPVPLLDGQGQPIPDDKGQLQPQWQVPPGAKASRARRVSEYLNTTLFYRMDGWEADTDALLTQLPIAGCVFRKTWFDQRKGAQSKMVSALRLVVPQGARDLLTTPRITEEIPDIYPHEIRCRQREGYYLDADLGEPEDDKPRLLLEQHCWADLDEDGYDEPYIVTVDKEARQVLRVEANFSERDIEWRGDVPIRIEPGRYYTKYGFFPHPEGKFYDIGLGHLLKHVGAAVDTALNQLLDAGNAQVAGGGFIGSGVRLQGRAGRSVVRFQPGEYKTVEIAGGALREGIVDRTLPEVSPVTFQVLEFIMGFSKEIAGTKDILTGQGPSTAPVGTVLAMIEQGLQVFNAIAKRFFRSAREEYQLLFEKMQRYGLETLGQDYQTVLDDPAADFRSDFADADMDIRPVSDPSAVTQMQKMAKAQFLESKMGAIATVGGDVREVLRRTLEAADIDDIDKLLPPPQPQPPDPRMLAELQKLSATAGKDAALGDKANADAMLKVIEAQERKYELEQKAISDGMRARSV